MSLDARLTLARPDLASQDLEGGVRAERFAAPVTRKVVWPSAPLRRDPAGALDDQLLFGERFDVLDQSGDLAWGQALRDGYVGFVPAAALGDPGEPPTHWVSAMRTFTFEAPLVRARASGPFSLNTLVRVDLEESGFSRTDAGWIASSHLTPIGVGRADVVAEMERFLEVPYLWGGRDSLGLDCSGLVQQGLYACGQACPRDSDQQQSLGRDVNDAARRGDLIFWKGHVGVMLDEARLLHANAHHMAVAIEPLAEAEARILAKGAGPVTCRRRLLG